MTYKIVPSSEELLPAVAAMNARMEAGGSRWKFYDTDLPDWLPPAPGATAWREFFLLVDESNGAVRGGFGLKYEQFQLNGEMVQLGWLQGPVAESAVDKSLKGLGSMMIKESLRRFPMQISWGANSIAAPSAGSAPMLLHIVNKGAFLKHAPILGEKPQTAKVASLAAAVGLGQAGLGLAQFALARLPPRPRRYQATEEPEFGGWADEIWEAAKDQYRLIALRDRPTLNRALPTDAYPNAIPLKVSVAGKVVGWAALRDRQLSGDSLFGDLRAGSVIDALALPGHEATVAAAAKKHLRARGVDMIGACFFHRGWTAAFRSAGFLVIPKRRNIGFTGALAEKAGGLDLLMKGTHLALIDSDGPRLF
jgi:hypothetical protein